MTKACFLSTWRFNYLENCKYSAYRNALSLAYQRRKLSTTTNTVITVDVSADEDRVHDSSDLPFTHPPSTPFFLLSLLVNPEKDPPGKAAGVGVEIELELATVPCASPLSAFA